MYRTRRWVKGWCLLAVVLIVASLLSVTARAQGHFPGTEWERKTPAEVGLNMERLNEFRRIVGGRGCIVRDGYLVYSWGEYDKPHDVASAIKPFYSFLLLKALEEGKIASFDEKVVKWQPSLARINARLSYKDRHMTFRHLGNQTACLGYVEAPGSAFDYNDATMGFFWDTIVNKVYGVAWKDAERLVIAPRLSTPLQFQDGTPGIYRGGRGNTGRFSVSARDFCRFGLLFMHKGKWRDKQVLREDLAVMAVTDPIPLTIPRTKGQKAESVPEARSMGGRGNQCDHNGGYSWMWWLNKRARDGELWFKDVPPDFFACFGHGGREGMAVLPAQRIIVSWIGKRLHQDRERGNRAFSTLIEATRPSGSRRGQIVVDPEHPARMVYADTWVKDSNYPGGKRLKPCVFVGPGDPEDFFWNDTAANLALLKARKARCTYITAELRDFGGGSLPAGDAMEPVLEEWDRLVTELEDAGIITVFFLLDDGGRRDDWPDFVDRIVAKLKHHRLLIWCVAEEYGELGKDSKRLITAMASRIKEKDTFNHIVGVHQNHGVTFDFTGEPSLDMFLMQINDQTPRSIHEWCVRAWRALAGKHILNMSECSNHVKEGDTTFRQLNWASVLGGAGAVQALYMGRAGDAKEWNGEQRYAACALQMDFFEATDVNYMSPRDDLGFEGADYVLANPGVSYIAYARRLRRKIGLRNMKAGRYDLKWLDCVTGRTILQENVPVAAGDRSFAKPGGLGGEAAVYVRRKG